MKIPWNMQAIEEFSDTCCGEAKASQNPAEQKEVDSEAEAAGRFSCRMKAKL